MATLKKKKSKTCMLKNSALIHCIWLTEVLIINTVGLKWGCREFLPWSSLGWSQNCWWICSLCPPLEFLGFRMRKEEVVVLRPVSFPDVEVTASFIKPWKALFLCYTIQCNPSGLKISSMLSPPPPSKHCKQYILTFLHSFFASKTNKNLGNADCSPCFKWLIPF